MSEHRPPRDPSVVERMAMYQPRPRRVFRLFASFAAILAGVAYLIFPPITTITYLEAAWLPRTWGAFMILGGVLCSIAWFKRVLKLDRAGIMAKLTGVITLTASQLGVMLDGSLTITRLGGTVVLLVLILYLIPRYQDVRHDEREAARAEKAHRTHRNEVMLDEW